MNFTKKSHELLHKDAEVKIMKILSVYNFYNYKIKIGHLQNKNWSRKRLNSPTGWTEGKGFFFEFSDSR